MSRIINPYEQLGSPSTGGTWSTLETTGLAPLPPDPPALYNDDLDFDAVDDGTYVYTYTVTNGTCTSVQDLSVTVTSHSQVDNDECSFATTMLFPYGGGHFITKNQYNIARCPGRGAPTDSGVDVPTEWGSDVYSGDMWYKFSYNPLNNPTGGVPIVAGFSVSSLNYISSKMKYPVIAVYSDCSGTLVEAVGYDIHNPYETTIVFTDIFSSSSFTYYIRVSCVSGNEGFFDLELTV